MRSMDLIGSFAIACLCTVFVGALDPLTKNTDLPTILRRIKRQATALGAAAMGAAAPGAAGGMPALWMDPPDGLPYYMMSSYMGRRGMGFQRYHDGIPGRLADASDAAQTVYRNTAAMRAMNSMNSIQSGPSQRSRPRPPPPPPQPSLPKVPAYSPSYRSYVGPPAPPPPAPLPTQRRGPAKTAARGMYFMSPDLIRAGLPSMLDPHRGGVVGPMIKQMRAMGRTPDQIADEIGDVLRI